MEDYLQYAPTNVFCKKSRLSISFVFIVYSLFPAAIYRILPDEHFSEPQLRETTLRSFRTPTDRPVIKPFREFPIFPAKQPCRRGIKYSNLYSSSASSLSRNRVTAPASSGEGDHGATFPGVNGAKGPCFTS